MTLNSNTLKFLPFALLLAVLSWGSFATITTAQFLHNNLSTLSPEQQQLIKQLDRKMNAQRTLSSRYIQLNPDGNFVEGTFWMRRPDQARFEYDAPAPLLLIASGNFLIEVDRELEQVSYYPQIESIATYLLSENVLQHPKLVILNMSNQEGLITVTLAEAEAPDEGAISLEFDASTLNLRRWTTTQSDQSQTTVTLIDPRYNLELDDDLFHFHAPENWSTLQ